MAKNENQSNEVIITAAKTTKFDPKRMKKRLDSQKKGIADIKKRRNLQELQEHYQLIVG